MTIRRSRSFARFLRLLWLLCATCEESVADRSVSADKQSTKVTQCDETGVDAETGTCQFDGNAHIPLALAPQYSVPYRDNDLDPNLREMTFDIGHGEETFLAYVQPDVTEFYKDRDLPSPIAMKPSFDGLSGKFINLSPRHVKLFWDPLDGSSALAMFDVGPFRNEGTAVHPGHEFFFADESDLSTELIRFVVAGAPHSVHYYDPFVVDGDAEATEQNLAVLTTQERKLYDRLRRTLMFNEAYLRFTGRSYLVNYPRSRPSHFMWPAEYFGQEHWMTTRETHVENLPPEDELRPVVATGKSRVLANGDPRFLQDYRADEPIFNLTLKVLSVAPRVFEIQKFLSPAEVQHILNLAHGEELSMSSVGTVESLEDVRTSFNSWLPRETSPVVDIVYRRAADLLRIDEKFLRMRDPDEDTEIDPEVSAAESLQLVHYDPDQSYNAHHDFGFAYAERAYQNDRFATMLFYLNEGMVGGTTSFPRWVNSETTDGLKVVPEVGKALLFYDQLPDGNTDDLSQHSADPVEEGEKWLTNLWVWDRFFEQ